MKLQDVCAWCGSKMSLPLLGSVFGCGGGDKEPKREMFLPNKRALAETKPNKLKHHQMRTGSRKV